MQKVNAHNIRVLSWRLAVSRVYLVLVTYSHNHVKS